MPIQLYMVDLSLPCQAVRLTAAQLNIDLDLKTVDVLGGENLKPEFLQMNPAHTIPTINDDGFILWESRAIMQYLCNRYAPDSTLYPKDPKKRAIVDRWLNFDMSYFEQQKEAVISKALFKSEPTEDKANAFRNSTKLLDQLIGDNKYLTGDELTIADLSLLAPTVLVDVVDFDFSDYPNYQRWYTGLRSSLPYFDAIIRYDRQELDIFVEKYKTRLAQQKDK